MKNLNKSRELYQNNKEYLLKVTPFREPVLQKGKGNTVWDIDGNQYLDMMSGQFCLAFGHCYSPFNKVVMSQLKKITHTNTLSLTEEMLQATADLASITHEDLKKTILLSTGAEAVECAMRYAKFYTKKQGIVGIGDGYHGLTHATQSISSFGKYAVPRLPYTYSIPTPDTTLRPEDMSEDEYIDKCIAETKKMIAPYKGTIAAFVIEPVISVGGMIYPPKSYFQQLKNVIAEHEAVLIFDECQTGLGRTGTWFGYEHYDLVPDMLVLAKISGNGLPVSAVVMRHRIAESVEGKFIHFSSHQNDPLSGAILSFVITHMKEKNTLEAIRKKGTKLLQKITAMAKNEKWIEHPRGLGLMIGFDLPQNLFTENRNPGQDLISLMEDRGVLIQAIRKGRTFRILPSYIISNHEINTFIAVLKDSMGALHKMYET